MDKSYYLFILIIICMALFFFLLVLVDDLQKIEASQALKHMVILELTASALFSPLTSFWRGCRL